MITTILVYIGIITVVSLTVLATYKIIKFVHQVYDTQSSLNYWISEVNNLRRDALKKYELDDIKKHLGSLDYDIQCIKYPSPTGINLCSKIQPEPKLCECTKKKKEKK